jgi:uncharacterized membrane protein YphA (DoxX/SURF4 family)
LNPFTRFVEWLEGPVLVIRMEVIRILAPLFVLGFMSRRFVHADEWIGSAGFRVPDLGQTDMRQPMYIPPLSNGVAWAIAGVMVVSGISVALGVRTRISALVFACTLTFVAMSDRLAAFTVSKISPVLMIAVAASPAGTRLGVDAWLERKEGGPKPEKMRRSGGLRFVQLFLPIFYCSSGVAKAFGDWLDTPHLLWTHLHDTYQTAASFWIGSMTPGWAWNLIQGAVLVFEVLAPIWLGVPLLRRFGFAFGMVMHLLIGIMFGPVVWFSFLMMTLLVGAYGPSRLLAPLERLASRLEEAQGETQTT